MSVYKEGYSIVNEIIANSSRIFPDAADYGMLISNSSQMWKNLKQLIEWYGVKGTRSENRYSTGSSVSHRIELVDEWAVSDGRKTEFQATEYYVVEYITTKHKPGYDGFVYIYEIK